MLSSVYQNDFAVSLKTKAYASKIQCKNNIMLTELNLNRIQDIFRSSFKNFPV
jgi:hypothetical protein